MKLLAVGMSVLLSVLTAHAGSVWYVDAACYEAETQDGSDAHPYGSIQRAIDAEATVAGDTILVRPGVYSNGVCTVAEYGSKDLQHPCRVLIHKDNLTIKSTGGRDDTHIVGVRDESDPSKHGAGPASVACVYLRNGITKFILDGFTLRDGTVENTNNSEKENGGGIGRCSWVAGSGYEGVHVFGCTISNCTARVGITQNCVLHRCLVAYNYSLNTGAAGILYGKAENTIFLANTGTAAQTSTLVNCVVTGTIGGKAIAYSRATCNSIISMNGSDRDSESANASYSFVTNSVVGPFDSSAEKFPAANVFNTAFSVPATNTFVAPVFGDFRLIEGSTAANRGTPSCLTDHITLPEGYVFKDYSGNVIDIEAERIHAGAIQEVVTPAGGCVLFSYTAKKTDGTKVRINGTPFYHSNAATYAYATTWPVQWCVTAAEGEFLSCVLEAKTSNQTHGTFAGKDGTIWITPPKHGEVREANVQLASAFYYLDPVNGSDAYDGSCPADQADPAHGKGPWRTLTYVGTNNVVNNDRRTVLYCAPGTYAEGSSNGARAFIQNNGGRMLHFVATEGPEKTFIVGAPDPDTKGLGPKALRALKSNNQIASGFVGFTLMQGYTDTATAAWASMIASAAYGLLDVVESVVSNNFAAEGIDYAGVRFDRCLIADNTSKLILSGGIYRGCVLRDNHANAGGYYGWIYSGRAMNCLFYLTPGVSGGDILATTGSKAYNSVFVNADRLLQAAEVRGCLLDNCSGAQTGFSDCRTGNAALAWPAMEDWRLTPGSDVGDLGVSDCADFSTLAATDYCGNPVVRDGKALVGAVVEVAPNGLAVDNRESRFTVSGDIPEGCNLIPEGATLTLSPNVASTRPVVGWAENGVTNEFGTATSHSWTYDEVLAAGGVRIDPVLGTEWFANANTDPSAGFVGSDGNHGFSRHFPKKTLAEALKNAVSGDTVWAAAGRYDEKSKNSGFSTPARAEVPQGVTLRSEEGCEKTFIVGAAGGNDDGTGDGAVRGVLLKEGASVIGFTVTGGNMCATGDTSPSYSASGICSYTWQDKGDTYVTDCVISNCAAHRFIIMGGVYTRCKLLENRTYTMGLGYSARMRNCLVARNRIGRNNGFQGGSFDNVTFAGDNVFDDTGKPFGNQFSYGETHIVNSVIFTKADPGAVTNCVFVNGQERDVFVNCQYLTAAEVALDADYKPIFGMSALIDAGTNACGYLSDAETWGTTDLAGNQRVMNGVIDIGAFEADWRPAYAADIRRSLVDVVSATPFVYETDRKSVALGKPGEGGALVIERRPGAFEGVDAIYKFLVTGNGVLTVMSGDTVLGSFVAASDPQTLKVDAAVTGLTFAYVPGEGDTGTAEILRASLDRGTAVIIR